MAVLGVCDEGTRLTDFLMSFQQRFFCAKKWYFCVSVVTRVCSTVDVFYCLAKLLTFLDTPKVHTNNVSSILKEYHFFNKFLSSNVFSFLAVHYRARQIFGCFVAIQGL